MGDSFLFSFTRESLFFKKTKQNFFLKVITEFAQNAIANPFSKGWMKKKGLKRNQLFKIDVYEEKKPPWILFRVFVFLFLRKWMVQLLVEIMTK